MMVGSGLAIVGASLQAVTRNPLADPHLLGISSGAAFGAILALLHTGLFVGLLTVPLFAFMGALVATIIILGVSRFTGATSADRLILTGVAVSFVIMAGANILIFLGDVRATHTVVFWMLGGLGFAQWTQLIYPFVILLFCGAWILSQESILNAMPVGDETAYTLRYSSCSFSFNCFCCLCTNYRGYGCIFRNYRFCRPYGTSHCKNAIWWRLYSSYTIICYAWGNSFIMGRYCCSNYNGSGRYSHWYSNWVSRWSFLYLAIRKEIIF